MASDGARQTASSVYYVTIEAHRRRGLRRLRTLVWLVASTLTMGFFGFPSVGEIVVRRRSDRVEVLRTDAEAEESAAQLIEHVHEQLRTLTPAEFRDRWGITDEPGPDGPPHGTPPSGGLRIIHPGD